MSRSEAPPPSGMGQSFDATARAATRDRRQELGRAAAMALHSIIRNARMYGEDNAVFNAPVDQLSDAIHGLLATDGQFELKQADDGLYVNRQGLRFEAGVTPLIAFVRAELGQRGMLGFTVASPPSKEDLRALVRLFTPTAPKRAAPQGDPKRPLTAITLLVDANAPEDQQSGGLDAQLVNAYSHAVFFVARYIEQLRSGGEAIPVWAASRVVQDLVDAQRQMPLRFVQIARTKAGADAYWGYHAANVAVLAITMGSRLGLSKRRKHDLGMAALFHDVGMAALPPAVLHKTEGLSDRERAAVDASPLFAARAVLRDREVHPAALERALAAYECHLDLAPQTGIKPEVGFVARVISICEAFDALTTTRPYRGAHRPAEALKIMQTELQHKLDQELVRLFSLVIEPLL